MMFQTLISKLLSRLFQTLEVCSNADFLVTKYKILLSCFALFSVLEEKQKSDVEEDGGTVSQEEEDRKPKAEVIERGRVYLNVSSNSVKVHLSREYFHRVIFNGCGSKNSITANFVKVEFLALKN